MTDARLNDIGELQAELRRLPDVIAARIVDDDEGNPVEIHVVATPSKHVKQLVRDIQTTAQARFGIDIDHRIISVVQFDADSPAAADIREEDDLQGSTARIQLSGFSVDTDGGLMSVRVRVERDGLAGSGEAGGPMVGSVALRTAADAALAAARDIEPAASRAAVESAMVVPVGPRIVATVTVVFATSANDDVVVGTAVVRAGETEAVVHAALDAVNRRVAGAG